MSEIKLPRLAAAATEFNVGKETLIELLHKKGFNDVEFKDTTKLTLEMYQICIDEFNSDKAAKFKADALEIPIAQNIRYTQSLIQNCINTKNTYLDIGMCGLYSQDLKEGSLLGNLLLQCTHIEILILSNEWLVDDNVCYSKNKYANNYFYKEITIINQLQNLKEITYGGEGINTWGIKSMNLVNELHNLVVLNLNNNQISEINGIVKLRNLRRLNLNNNQISEIKNLNELTQLTHLNLSGNKIAEIKNLSSLKELKVLSLNGNKIDEIKGLETLINLTTLSIIYNNLKEIKGLQSVKNLLHLELANNFIEEIKNLEELKNLERLELSNNQISEIKNLNNLTKLRRLNLFSNKIVEIKNLEKLSNLNELNLSANRITDIKNLEHLTNLRILSLWGNQIQAISNLKELKNLNELYLSNNKIEIVKGLEDLTKLTHLGLSNNLITELKNLDFLENMPILDFRINNNPFVETHLLRIPETENQLHYLQDFFKRQNDKNKISIAYPIKVLMLGNHNVGKTSLVNSITKNTKIGSTHILRIINYNITPQKKMLPDAIFFDFGGQDFYHGIYRAFMSSGCLQIILFDGSITQNLLVKDSENIEVFNYNLHYWLGQKQYLQSATIENRNPDPFFVVQTYAEIGNPEVRSINFSEYIGFQKSFYLSLKDENHLTLKQRNNSVIYNSDRENFKTYFNHTIQKYAYKTEEPSWYVDFLNFIYSKDDKDFNAIEINKVLLHFKSTNYNGIDKIEELKRYLEQLHLSGLVLYYSKIDSLKNIVWLNPEALVTHIQNNILKKEIITREGGVVKIKDATTVFEDENILALLQEQKVVFLHKPHENDVTKHEYIIPNYLPIANNSNTDYQLLTFGFSSPDFIIKFVSFIPFGLINQMICFFGRQPDVKIFWRNQLLFTLDKNARVLIKLNYEDLTIQVSIQQYNGNKEGLNKIISYLFDAIMVLYWDIRINEDKVDNDINGLNSNSFIGGYKIQSNIDRISRNVLNEFLNRKDTFLSLDCLNYVNFEDLMQTESKETKILAYPLVGNNINLVKSKEIAIYPFSVFTNKSYSKIKKIFISYSKHDEEYKEEFRKHLVTLRDQKLIEDFNCKQIDLGTDWDATIQREIDECDYMICLVSVDFLNTPYIRKYEIANAIKKGKTLIPIIIKPCDWEESEIGKFYASERGHTISLKKELFLRDIIKENTAIERAGFWTKIVKEFRDKIFKD